MNADLALFVLRVVVGGVVMQHGLLKMGIVGQGGSIAGVAGWFNGMGLRPGMFWALVATAVAELPKETTIPVVDVSALDAPVKISGLVATKDQPTKTLRYSFETNVSIANVSTKPILLMVVKLEVISPYKIRLNYSEEDDFSFESQILQLSTLRQAGPMLCALSVSPCRKV